MPMGLQGAPGTFQEAVNEILAEEIKEGFVKVYMDDVSVYSEDEDSHLIHVGRVVDKLKAHALKVKKSKCEIAKFEIKFLGHVVSQDSIKPDPERVSVLKSKEMPQTLAQLWSFMGLANYHRKFIENYAEIARPLYELQDTKSPETK